MHSGNIVLNLGQLYFKFVNIMRGNSVEGHVRCAVHTHTSSVHPVITLSNITRGTCNSVEGQVYAVLSTHVLACTQSPLTLTPCTVVLRDRAVGLVPYSGVVLTFVHNVSLVGLQQCQYLHVVVLLCYGVWGLSGLQTNPDRMEFKKINRGIFTERL